VPHGTNKKLKVNEEVSRDNVMTGEADGKNIVDSLTQQQSM